MPRESQADKQQRVRQIIASLRKAYPHAQCALNHKDAWQLLVATILSAQCTDERVNIVTEDLFETYRSPEDFAKADPAALQEDVRSTGFYRNKAKNIQAAARQIVDEHGGEVPEEMDALLDLPGVARKTANVVLGTWYKKNVGVVVDTHVARLSQRLKLTAHKNNQSDRIEKDLIKLVPQDDWTDFSHLMIFHGRAICTARKPDCETCPISDLCPSAFKV